MSKRRVAVALLYPDLLGTYGDAGNAVILAQRLRWRGFDVDMVTVRSGEPVPASCEFYVVGGGEDLPQSLAARQLRDTGGHPGPPPLQRAVDGGAAVLAVCAGMQIVGRSFVGPGGEAASGLGLLDCTTTLGRGRRAVGEIVVEPDAGLGLSTLSGYENHAGWTTLGPASRPLGSVRVGIGNGDGFDGARTGRVVGTYLHGPVLARNPDLADLLLSSVLGPLDPLDDSESEGLREERLATATAGQSRGNRWRIGRR